MGIFDKTKGQKRSEGGVYFPKDFDGIVMINRVKRDTAQSDVEYVAIETIILTSNRADTRPGSPATEQIMGNWKGAGSLLLDFGLTAFEGLTGTKIPDPVTDKDHAEFKALMESYVSEEQPCAGLALHVRTFGKPDKDFTNHRWRVPTDDEKKAAAAAMVELGLKKAA